MTAELSTEIDEQKEEMEQLKKEKNDILDDMEAHKLAVSKLCIVNYMHLRVHAAILSFVESLSSFRVCIHKCTFLSSFGVSFIHYIYGMNDTVYSHWLHSY